MSGSAELHKKLRDPNAISVPAGGYYLQSLSDNYMINGAHRECHPDFIATPIGDSPYGFLVCQRKINPQTALPPESIRKEMITNFQPYEDYSSRTGGSRLTNFAQTFDMYKSVPNSHPRTTFLGGQALDFYDRRIPNQATLTAGGCPKFPLDTTVDTCVNDWYQNNSSTASSTNFYLSSGIYTFSDSKGFDFQNKWAAPSQS